MNEKSLKATQQVGPYEDEYEFLGNKVKTNWTAVVEQKDDGTYTFHIAYSITCKDKNLLHFIEKGIPKIYQHVPINDSLGSDLVGYPTGDIDRRLSFRSGERKDKDGNFVYERSEVINGLYPDRLQEWYDMTIGLGFDKIDIKSNLSEASKLFYKQFSGLIAGSIHQLMKRLEEER